MDIGQYGNIGPVVVKHAILETNIDTDTAIVQLHRTREMIVQEVPLITGIMALNNNRKSRGTSSIKRAIKTQIVQVRIEINILILFSSLFKKLTVFK